MKFHETKIELNRLVKTTIKILKDNSLDCSILAKEQPSRNFKNVWSLISSAYFNRKQYKDSINIYSWWLRNTNCYADILLENFFNCKSTKEELMDIDILTENKKSLEIYLDLEDILNLKNFITKSYGRSQFNSNFSIFLSEKIQEHGFNCWLKSKSNWFKKINSQKKNAPFWNGLYVCIGKDCTQKFNCKINDDFMIKETFFEKEDAKGIISVSYNQTDTTHVKLLGKKRCSGKERTVQSKDVLAHGVMYSSLSNVLNNNEQSSILDHKVTKRSTLSMMKYALVHFYKISNEVFIDALAAKNVTDKILSEGNLNGYIQEVNLSPYGFLLISQIQINIWSIIRNSNDVWFFDATGSIHKKIPNQKKPFFYSIIMHDVEQKVLIPFSEFVTTANDQITITKYLRSIQNKLNKNYYPNVIVTDMSWALINSVLTAFNSCSISDYLNIVFEKLFINEKINIEEKIKTKIYLCSTHVLKNIIKKAKKIKVDKSVQYSFLFVFTLIQNSRSILEVENYLQNIHNVFNNPVFDESVVYSFNLLQQKIKDRKLTNIDLSEERTPEQTIRYNEFKSYFKSSKLVIEEEKIEKNCPFKKYYDGLIEGFKQNISIKGEKCYKKNRYYSPDLFIILKNQLFNLPLWTGVLLNDCKISYKIKSRLSNNPVENWFSQLKNKLSLKNRSTSEIAAVSYKNIAAKYNIYYCKEYKFETNLFDKNSKEIWIDKKKKSQKKGYFYENHELTNIDYDELNFQSERFNIAFSYDKTELIKNSIEKHESVVEMNYGDYLEKIFEDSKAGKKETISIDNSLKENTSNKIIPKRNETIFEVENFKNYLKTDFITQIEKNSSNFEFIKKKFVENSELFDRLIEEIQNISLNLVFRGQNNYKKFKKRLNLDKHFFAICTNPDGNCLYNSISLLCFDNQNDFLIIKSCSIYTIFKNEWLFEKLIKEQKYPFSLEEFICKTCRRKEWATEINIFSICLLLKRKILCYNESLRKDQTTRLSYSFEIKYEEVIRIGLVASHFFPILSSGLGEEKRSLEFNFYDPKYSK